MDIQEMTASECRAMLTRVRVARLACSRNNQPYIVPIHVDLEDEFLYGYATLGQKIEWMRENGLVCLELDELTTRGPGRAWSSSVNTRSCLARPSMRARERSPSDCFSSILPGGSLPRSRWPSIHSVRRLCFGFGSTG